MRYQYSFILDAEIQAGAECPCINSDDHCCRIIKMKTGRDAECPFLSCPPLLGTMCPLTLKSGY